MVVVDPGVALRLDPEVYAGVVGQQVQKVVQKAHARRDLGLAGPVQLHAHPDEGLPRSPFRTTLTCHYPPVLYDPEHSRRSPPFWSDIRRIYFSRTRTL